MRDFYGDVKRFVPSTPQRKPLPPPEQTDQPQRPSFPYHSPEERLLWKAIGIDPDGGWDPNGIPAFTTSYRKLEPFTGKFPDNGQPPEVNTRRNWSTAIVKCDHCGGPAAYWIDRYELRQGHYCDGCHADYRGISYLEIELNRRHDNAIISEFQGFIANDPELKTESLWGNGIFHLGSPMGSGKTTLIYERARQAAATSNAITILFVPRISLAQAAHAELTRNDTGLAWSLFHEGSENAKRKSEKWKIGEYGAVSTLGMMPHLLKVIAKDHRDRPVRLFFDEIDFTDSLRLSEIFKAQSTEITEILKESAQETGIVTAGQTASTLALNAIATSLEANLKCYYGAQAPTVQDAALCIVKSTETDHPKNLLTQAAIRQVQEIIHNTHKSVYLFADERRFCQLIQHQFPSQTLLYDAYHRGSPEATEALRRKGLPEGKRIFVSSNAVDVGISIEDANAETIVVSLANTLNIGGVDSVVQRCMRNRTRPPLTIYLLKHENPLPISPSEATGLYTANAHRLMNDDDPDDRTSQSLGIKFAMDSLIDNQPETFIKHHLKLAGFSVEHTPIKASQDALGEWIKQATIQIRETEAQQVKEAARELLAPERLLTEPEIRQRSWEDSQPAPINKLSHEKANESLRMTGWDGRLERFADEDGMIEKTDDEAFADEGVTDEMWEVARDAVDLNFDKASKWKIGFLGTHFPDAIHEESEPTHMAHHRQDKRPLALFIKSLLGRMPRTPKPKTDIAQALIDAAQVRYGDRRLADMIKDGSISPVIAKQFRFVMLGPDAPPTDTHFDIAKRLIRTYYPARIVEMDKGIYQLASTTDTGELFRFYRVTKSHLTHRHPEIVGKSEGRELLPEIVEDPLEKKREKAKEMVKEGKSSRQIAKALGMSRSWVLKQKKDSEAKQGGHGGPILKTKDLGPRGHLDAIPESLRSHAPTVFEAIFDTKNESSIESSHAALDEATETDTLQAKILSLLSESEKDTSTLIKNIIGHPASIKRELTRMTNAGVIARTQRGRYALPEPEGDPILF